MEHERVVIVTGAGSGVGRTTAIAMGARQWSVVLVGRRRERLEETAELVESETLVLPSDIGREDDALSIVPATIEAFGRIDAIVNNAAIAPAKPVETFAWDELEHLYRINSIGPHVLINSAWDVFRAQRAAEESTARVVNLSSVATIDPFPGLTPYAASKAAVNLLTKGCANEGEEIGLRAFAVAPGAIETEMLRAFVTEEQLPKDATLRPEDVAEVVVSCVMGERDEENGSVILVPSPA